MPRLPLTLLLFAALAFPASARADDPPKAFPFTGITLAYYVKDKSQPPIADLLKTAIPLDVVDGTYIAPALGRTPTPIPLEKLGAGDVHQIDASAIKALYSHLIAALADRHLIGTFVVIDDKDINEHDEDIRTDHTTLTFILITSRIVQMRTVHFQPGHQQPLINDPADAHFLKDSPLHTVAEGGPDLLDKAALDTYMQTLAKAGTPIDISLSGNGSTGEVTLDFLISSPPAPAPATAPATAPAP